MDDRQDLIIRLRNYLQRMKDNGKENTDGYKSLHRKLEAIEAGCNYKVTDVTEKLIKTYSAFIPVCNTLTNSGKQTTYTIKILNEAIDYVNKLWNE